MKKTLLTAALLSAALPSVANAAFVVTYPSVQLVPTVNPGRNNFAADLALNGISLFASTNASIALTTGGKITFEYMGKESLLLPTFTAGSVSFTPLATDPVIVNNFASPVNIGSATFAAGNFAPTFFSAGAAGIFAPGSGFFGIGLPSSLSSKSGTYATNTLWLLYDDNAVPDDNHDDLIIRATFAVPEPSTWAMMILGFGVIGLVMRRRTQQRVSFV